MRARLGRAALRAARVSAAAVQGARRVLRPRLCECATGWGGPGCLDEAVRGRLRRGTAYAATTASPGAPSRLARPR
eukprot:5132616-Prymnesium_polylepis.1